MTYASRIARTARTSMTLAVLALTLGLLAAACTDGGPGPGPTSTAPTASPEPTGGDRGLRFVEVWLTHDGKVHPARRIVDETPAIGTATLQLLLAGPTEAEADVGFDTAIPEGTELEELTIEDGIARAEFSTAVESDPVSDAQVVFTLAQFPTVERVIINDQEGGPLGPDDLEEFVSPIVVEEPGAGEGPFSSPIRVSGTADVFEATVSIRILDEQGTVIADTTTMATCGTGCRGDYRANVEFSVDEIQAGTVVVFEASAETGKPIHAIRIPVLLGATP